MSDKQTQTPLADQRFLLAPGADELALPGEIDPATDLDIIANTYRAIVDQHAFEAMIASWNAKLDGADVDGTARPTDAPLSGGASARSLLSGPLLQQLAAARNTMETLDIPAENDPLSRAVRDVPGPAVVLAPDGRIAAANVAGAAAFGVRQGGYFDTGTIDPRSRQDFDALRKAADTPGNRSHAVLRILPAGGAEWARPFVAEGFLLPAPDQEKFFLVLRSLEIEWTPGATRRLAQAFGLSDAEGEVARLFFSLRDVSEVARARGVSTLTARTQMKAVMAKTETASQVDLLRLLAMVASRAVMGKRGRVPEWHDPLGREERVTLSDGRVVAWTWMGAEDGVPAVMLRGIPVGYLLPEAQQERLRAANIRLYALSRPGYGSSTMDSSLSALDDNMACLRAFLDRRIARPCVGIGLSNGIVPLLAEEQAHPGRFASLVAVGYTGILDRSGMDRLPPIPRTMLRLVNRAPWLVELMAKSGHRMMQQHGVDWYLERAYRNTPRDQATCGDPNALALLRSASAHLLMQGHGTFVRDLQLIRAPVDDALDTLGVQMLWLAPMEDGVFDEARYRRIERRNPRIRVEPVPDAGELILYQQSARIVDRIIEAVAAAR